MTVENTTRSTMQMSSVLRSFLILEKLAEMQPVSLRELVAELGYSKSTIQRTLTTLEAAGWIHQTSPDTTTWEVSARAFAVRPQVLNGTTLLARAQSVMTELMTETDETIHLSILNDPSSVALIERIDCSQPVRTYTPIGSLSPIHATANGKAMLAYLSAREIELVVSGKLERYQKNTITEPDRLLAELAQVRRDGYAVNNSEYRSAVAAIGAPIFDTTDRPVAAICISMPGSRFDPEKVEKLGLLTRQYADRISVRRESKPGMPLS